MENSVYPGIDVNRGVSIRMIPGSDIKVFMYKDEPGVFRNAYGTVVDEKLARKAGYPTERLAKMRQRNLEVEKVKARLEAELEIRTTGEDYAERNGYKVIAYENGCAHLLDPEGNRYNDVPMPLELAMELLDDLAGKAQPKTAAAPKGQPQAVDKPK